MILMFLNLNVFNFSKIIFQILLIIYQILMKVFGYAGLKV